MSSGSQRGSRRSRGRGRGKVHSERKRKSKKHRSGGKYLQEKCGTPALDEVGEKTLGRLGKLAGQTFAFSPFSQYYDDWLLSLKSVLSEFVSNRAIVVDTEFVEECSQILAEVELKLAEKEREESILEETARRLAEKNNLLIQTDTECSHLTQKLESQRNSEIKRLTRRVHDAEEKLEETTRIKTTIFSPFARRAKAHKIAEATRKLDILKSELESTVKAFDSKQGKLRDDYEERKQVIREQVKSLKQRIGGFETDGSVEHRRFACEALAKSVKALLQRKMSFR